jgi:hypothetical protein
MQGDCMRDGKKKNVVYMDPFRPDTLVSYSGIPERRKVVG